MAIDEGADEAAPFTHLVGREYRLLVGLDSAIGASPVLTEHDGLLTLYIKCPGLEAMDLGCALARWLPDGGDWPVCGAVARVQRGR